MSLGMYIIQVTDMTGIQLHTRYALVEGAGIAAKSTLHTLKRMTG